MSQTTSTPDTTTTTPSSTATPPASGTGTLLGSQGGAAGAASRPEGGGGQSDWFASIPAELQADKTIAGLKGKGVADMATMLVNAQKLVGAKGITIPGKDAKPEDWASVWNQLGRPEKPEGYRKVENLPAGVQLNGEQAQAFSAFAHEIGLTDEQHARLLRFEAERVAAASEASSKGAVERAKAAVDSLRKEWGSAYDQNLGLAREAAKRFGGEEIVSDPVLGNDPRVIAMLAKAGKAIAQDAFIGTGQRQFRMSPSEAKSELDRVGKDRDFMAAYQDRQHPKHSETKARYRELLAASEG